MQCKLALKRTGSWKMVTWMRKATTTSRQRTTDTWTKMSSIWFVPEKWWKQRHALSRFRVQSNVQLVVFHQSVMLFNDKSRYIWKSVFAITRLSFDHKARHNWAETETHVVSLMTGCFTSKKNEIPEKLCQKLDQLNLIVKCYNKIIKITILTILKTSELNCYDYSISLCFSVSGIQRQKSVSGCQKVFALFNAEFVKQQATKKC